jgi:hypothetical protein
VAKWSDGRTLLEVELRGLAGLRAEIGARGRTFAHIPCKDGKASLLWDSRRGDPAPQLAVGDVVEVRQNGHVVLRGALILSPRLSSLFAQGE